MLKTYLINTKVMKYKERNNKELNPPHAMNFAVSLDENSIRLRVIHSSGHAELEWLVRRRLFF
jgi:hypothetical protein